eukprot:2328239-Pyramimonas_sp.AAC.1
MSHLRLLVAVMAAGVCLQLKLEERWGGTDAAETTTTCVALRPLQSLSSLILSPRPPGGHQPGVRELR